LGPGNWPGRGGVKLSVRPFDEVAWRPVARWHALLRAIAALNVILWSWSAIAVMRGPTAPGGGGVAASRVQLLLSAVYVIGCAYRSMLPVYDIPRIVLVDSRLSSVMAGRTIATVAELCFAAQWALILHRAALLSHSLIAQAASLGIVPLIVIAETCSWHAVLTTDQRGHIAENSIWGLAAVLVVASMVAIGFHGVAALYPPMILWCVAAAGYAVFMFLFDVPMYWSRWAADQLTGRRYLSISQGVVDASRRRIVSYRWEDWKTEVVWMSLYFAFGVWSSISIVHASIALYARGY
jgi:hypothetical protein